MVKMPKEAKFKPEQSCHMPLAHSRPLVKSDNFYAALRPLEVQIVRLNSNCQQYHYRTNNCMDIWNFPTQGMNYEKFRPQYPKELCGEALDPLVNREKYLDIAVGTGKILLSFCESFKQTKGIDVSENMLDVASYNVQKFRQTHPAHQIVLQKHHVMELEENDHFDLVTVGQALHFFPVEQALRKIKNILNEGGMLMVFGYVLREVHSQNPKENDHFYEFYDMMLPYFTFDMYDLHHHYTDEKKYPFEKVFERVERKQTDLTVEMSKEQYLNYLKTWSAYGLYQSKHGVDPIQKLASVTSEKVTCVFDYFRIRSFK